MGSAYSSRKRRVGRSSKPSRHAWSRVQDLDFEQSDNEGSDDDKWWLGDRRVQGLDEVTDWPRNCPVMHLNIQKDFPLDAQRSFVRSCYRFWLFSWWVSVINFMAIMSSLLTSNVTNSESMTWAFLYSVIYLFGVFFLYFRAIYWAIRLESTVLFIWFYVASMAVIGFIVLQVTEALGLVSILAAPLAPGSALPVKVNPIFPVILFAMVILLYLLSLVFAIYHLSAAVKWQKMTDKEKTKLFKRQKKKGWLSFGKSGKESDDLSDDDDPASDKPKYSYPCTLTYDKVNSDYAEHPKGKAKKIKPVYETLVIPGTIGIHPSTREIKFTANETIFSNLFQLNVLFINIATIVSDKKTVLTVNEKLNEGVDDEDLGAFQELTATCNKPGSTERKLNFEFDTKQECTSCMNNMKKLWKDIKAKENVFLAKDEEILRQRRVNSASKQRMRAAQHLLTHKDWKLLVSFVWRRTYQAGEIILDKGSQIHEVLHVTEGDVSMYLETSESLSEKMKQKEKEIEENEDAIQSMLFPEQPSAPFNERAPSLESVQIGSESIYRPRYFTVRFTNSKLGYSSRKTTRNYSLDRFQEEAKARGEVPKRVFPNNQGIIVYKVKKGSEAEKLGIKIGDELVKVGLFDVEANGLSQKSVQKLVKNHSFPITMEFRRPPDLNIQEDTDGYVVPNPNLVPEIVRENLRKYEQHSSNGGFHPAELYIGNMSRLHPLQEIAEEQESGLLNEDSGTSEEEEEEEEEIMSHPLDMKSMLGNVQSPQKKTKPSYDPNSIAVPGSYPGWNEEQQDDVLIDFGTPQDPEDQLEGGVSALDLAEAYASQTSNQNAASKPAKFSAHRPIKSTLEEVVEFDSSAPTISDLARKHISENKPPAQEEASTAGSVIGNSSMAAKVMATGRRFLFGKEIEYNKIIENSLREQIQDPDEVPIFVDGNEEAVQASRMSFSDIGFSSDEEDHEPDMEDIFSSIQTFEPVGKFTKGDSIGIIPWILNQPVMVVQLRAETDVVLHAIAVNDLSNLFRKNGALALAFFKYVAAAIGERADRDEEKLVDQIENELLSGEASDVSHNVLRRLLDNKPIHTAQKTMHEKRSEDLDDARQYFELDFDMAFDSIIDQVECNLQIVGDITVVVAEQWKGVERVDRNEMQEGTLFITHYHLCFRTKKRHIDLTRFRRRPTFYGKVHLNDIYEISRYGNSGETLVVKTDDLRLEIRFSSSDKALMVEDWVHALLKTGTIVERAPHSYTLPGDLYGLSSGKQDSNLPDTVSSDPLNIVYTQQHDLRTEFLIVTQTLQQVLTNQDKYKMFHSGNSVTLKRNQNVLIASRVNPSEERQSKKDPNSGRRTTASKRALELDGPNGLYLVGSGELVVQREVNGRRVQFASYKVGTVFGVERFLTGAPSPFTIKVASERAVLKFAPRDRCMALLRADLGLAARFYQYCALMQLQRLRGPIISRPIAESESDAVSVPNRGTKGCSIL